MQSDPLGLGGGLNTFSYVTSDPLVLQDPMGLMGFGRGGMSGGYWGRVSDPNQSKQDALTQLWNGWMDIARSLDQGMQTLRPIPSDDSWKKNCVTAECAAGLPYIPTDTRTEDQIKKDGCNLVCNVVTTPVSLACPGPTGKGALDFALKFAAKKTTCEMVCN